MCSGKPRNKKREGSKSECSLAQPGAREGPHRAASVFSGQCSAVADRHSLLTDVERRVCFSVTSMEGHILLSPMEVGSEIRSC